MIKKTLKFKIRSYNNIKKIIDQNLKNGRKKNQIMKNKFIM